MKTFTIGWLNKCRCGNKSHAVKTARGNESALWDDDAVKCYSCGRGGVIQVCEGHARVLWETDEEMAEGKPMSTITKEWLQQKIAEMEAARDEIPFGLDEDDSNTLAALRIALASLEAEAVCVIDQSNLDYLKSGSDADVWPASRTEMGDVLLYRAAPPAPVSVPDGVLKSLLPDAEKSEFWFEHDGKILFEGVKFNNAVFDACRAAMLQGADGNSPVIPDGLRLALSNAGIAAPESDEMLAATYEKHIQALVTWVKDRKPFKSAVIPDGWVMVPEEPTHEMLEAGDEQFGTYDVYRRMIAASPQQK
ncbi:hypothetical protein [Enterobacter hormaechei]|uniref:hypothetical protein n=1 Tax=Enterobacter hormaechei TaxID=158836 RepID=UPI0023794AA3|nr:hypothetical protein [Enterobacter hormaechei]MDJ1452096.1 hypothetical protein [Enterobacter hormaechei subsp. xiangfangensis]MDR9953901.1 hypothetical protein [Enterobacter hormaechei subsp. xiangfangensis]MDS0083808.1 hypothetical protein [Enterobacter hormaechei subsp. xiangfangensis]MDS0093136.1 hypothetical protein [Enterobacter hormaechei subsp. xiangfangensis]MDS0102729.1 hypothetical protein [Enterobacter hormaechei subsp. xiangfangensis]